MKNIFLLIAVCLITSTCFAKPNTKTFVLTLINNTSSSFIFEGVEDENPGNVFSIDKTEIPAHAKAIIQGSIQKDYDLAARLNFSNLKKQKNIFLLINPRNMHSTQPVLSLHNSIFYSVIHSVTGGNSSDPRGLLLKAATLSLENNT